MRLHDWPERLRAVLAAARTRAYAFGEHDCALHGADVAEAVTGVDPAAAYRGRYKTYARGVALLRKIDGVEGVVGWADKLWPRVDPAHARRGDWAWATVVGEDGQPGEALTVVMGPVLIGPEGVRVPRDHALICWSVG